jgi:hypothetical protein
MAKVLVEQVAHTTHPRELTRNPEPEEGLSCHDDLDHRKVTRRPRLSVCPRRLSIALYFASYVVLDLCFVSVNWKGLNKLDYTGSHMSHDISSCSKPVQHFQDCSPRFSFGPSTRFVNSMGHSFICVTTLQLQLPI